MTEQQADALLFYDFCNISYYCICYIQWFSIINVKSLSIHKNTFEYCTRIFQCANHIFVMYDSQRFMARDIWLNGNIGT